MKHLRSIYSLGNTPELLEAMEILQDTLADPSKAAEAQIILHKYFLQAIETELRESDCACIKRLDIDGIIQRGYTTEDEGLIISTPLNGGGWHSTKCATYLRWVESLK